MNVSDATKNPIPSRVNPIGDFTKILKKENGLRYMIEEYYATREALLEALQNAYLKDNRNGAVQAGVLHGFRLAYEVIPSMVLRRIEEEEAAKEDRPSNADSFYEHDTGY